VSDQPPHQSSVCVLEHQLNDVCEQGDYENSHSRDTILEHILVVCSLSGVVVAMAIMETERSTDLATLFVHLYFC